VFNAAEAARFLNWKREQLKVKSHAGKHHYRLAELCGWRCEGVTETERGLCDF
jgi:hypothetical protein